jgi:hypothetical protein
MESLGDLYVQIQVVTNKFEQGLNWIKNQSITAVNSIQKTFDSLRFNNDSIQKGFDGINLTSNELKARITELKGKMEAYANSIGVSEQVLAKSTSKQAAYYQRLQAEIQATKNKLAEVTAEQEAAGNAGSGGFNRLEGMLTRIMIRMAAMLAIREVFTLLKDAVKDFSDMQQAAERLAFSLGKVSPSLEASAKAMQKNSEFSRADITNTQAEYAEYTKNESIINSLTQATIDLAAAKGIKLTQASQQVTEAITGTGTQLQKYGIQTSGAAESTQRLDSIIKGISNRFGGSATENLKTYAGSMENATNQMKEQGMTLGEQLAPAIQAVAQWWVNMTQKSTAFAGAGTFLVGSLKFIASALMIVVEAGKDVIDVCGTLVASIMAVSQLNFSGAWNILKKGFTDMNKQDTDTFIKIGQMWVGKEQPVLPKKSEGNATPPVDKKAIAEAKKLTEDFYKSLDESSTAYYTYQKKKIDEEYQKYSKVIKDKKVLDEWYVQELEKLNDKQNKSSDAKIDKQGEIVKSEQEYLTLTKQNTSFAIQAAIDRVDALLKENMSLDERNKLLKERKDLEDSLKDNGTNIVNLDGAKAFKPAMNSIDDKTMDSLKNQSEANVKELGVNKSGESNNDKLLDEWKKQHKEIVAVTNTTVHSIEEAWGTGISNWIMEGKSFTSSMGDAFTSMADTIIQKIVEIGVQIALLKAAEAIFSDATGGIGGLIINALGGGASSRLATTGNATGFDASPVSQSIAIANSNNSSLLNEMKATTGAVKSLNFNLMTKSGNSNVSVDVRGQVKGSDLALITNKANSLKNRIS